MRDYVLNVMDVSKSFRLGEKKIDAVQNVSLFVDSGESVALIGESGCGKSTLARLITRLDTPDEGKIILCGEDITRLHGIKLRKAYNNIKMIFQEPRSSFDPRFTIGASIRQSLKAAGKLTRHEYAQESARLLCEAGLNESYDKLYPRDLSGGECQRAAIVRAVAAKPRLIICDEATSALDVSVQAQILELLRDLGKKKNMSFLFISHDLALVSSFCTRTYVMYNGKVVENGKTRQIISSPKNNYTKKLIESVIHLDYA